MNHLGHIPVSLIQFVVLNKQTTYFRTYIALKYQFTNRAKIKKGSEELKGFIVKYGINERTLNRHLAFLEKAGFIGKVDKKVYLIRGYRTLRNSFNLVKGRKVELTEGDLKYDRFEPYLIGSLVGYFALKKKFDKRREELNKGGLKQSRRKSNMTPKEQTFPLAVRYLSYYIGRSKSGIAAKIKAAVECGYLYLLEDKERIDLPSTYLSDLLKQYQEGEPFPVINNGCLAFHHPNRFLNKLTYKRIRK